MIRSREKVLERLGHAEHYLVHESIIDERNSCSFHRLVIKQHADVLRCTAHSVTNRFRPTYATDPGGLRR